MGILINNGNVVFSDTIKNVDIYIEKEKIKIIERFINPALLPPNTELIDASGLYVFPGFIDAHTHYGLGEEGNKTADGFFEGSRAAAFGGVTTFIDFADQISGKTLQEGAVKRIHEAEEATIDFTLHQCIYNMHDQISLELDSLKSFGVGVVKLFMTYKEFGCYLDPDYWSSLFPLCCEKKILVTLHAEADELISKINIKFKDRKLSAEMHPVLRPSEAESLAILRAGKAAAQFSLPLYIVHLSSKAGMDVIRKLRNEGVKLYVETTPHYLLLTDSKLKGKDGCNFIMTPPLRKATDNRELRSALVSGEIGIVATDHCSYTPEYKSSFADCREIPAGIPGSEEMSSLIYSSLVAEGSMEMIQMGHILSGNPAKVFGLYPEKGSLKPGTDADIVVFSPEANGTFSKKNIHSNADYTAYEGLNFTGSPLITILRGNVIFRNGKFTGKRGGGRFIRSGESSLYRY